MDTWQEARVRFVKIQNIILITACFAVVWYFMLSSDVWMPFSFMGDIAVIGIYLIIYSMFGRIYEAFLLSYSRISELVYSQMLAVIASNFIMYLVSILLMRSIPNVLPFIFLFGLQLVVSTLWCYYMHIWYFNHFPAKKTIVVWDMHKDMEELVSSYGMKKKFEVIADYSVDDCINNIELLKDAEVVFLSGVHSHERNIIIKYCVQHKIASFMVPRIGDVLMSGSKKMHLFHLPILRLASYCPSPEYTVLKRVADIVFSALALILTIPLQMGVAIAIKLEDGGPIFYKQVRLTKDGREFKLWKYRSMRVDAESDGAKLSSGEADERITNVGRVIRRTRLDEIPQFVNILLGDMSIVGPRPERPEIAALYEAELPEFRLRLQAKAGLTGYAQIYGKYNTEPYHKLQMDLMYIANPSIAQDLSIMLATLKVLLLKDSTEGIENGSINALKKLD